MIPRIALFNHKSNIFKNHSQYEDLYGNINQTLQKTGLTHVIFFDDNDCFKLLKELETEWEMRWLQESFHRNQDGRIRSDMCRLAMLWKHGGFYFDNDIYLLKNITQYIYDTTTFATCKTTTVFKNPRGFFQAFIASTPRHFILKQALYNHVIWFDVLRSQHTEEIKRITNGVVNPNLGTVFLRDALVHFFGERFAKRLERTGYSYHKRMQLFVEDPLSSFHETYNVATDLCVPCEIADPCGFTVFDISTGDALFKSRIVDYNTKKACQIFCTVPLNCAQSKKRVRKKWLPLFGLRRMKRREK